jgi:hypothetical protein
MPVRRIIGVATVQMPINDDRICTPHGAILVLLEAFDDGLYRASVPAIDMSPAEAMEPAEAVAVLRGCLVAMAIGGPPTDPITQQVHTLVRPKTARSRRFVGDSVPPGG